MDDKEQPQQGQSMDTRYLAVVGVLLVMIIASLAALWLMERQRRVAAQQQLAEAGNPLSELLKKVDGPAPGGLPRARGEAALGAEDIIRKTPTEGGDELTITAAAGERLGLSPGDVVTVARPLGTRPAAPDDR